MSLDYDTKQNDKELPVRKDIILPTSRNKKAKKLNPAERVIVINRMYEDLEVLQLATLNPIKAVELCKKWGPFLPKYARPLWWVSTFPKVTLFFLVKGH